MCMGPMVLLQFSGGNGRNSGLHRQGLLCWDDDGYDVDSFEDDYSYGGDDVSADDDGGDVYYYFDRGYCETGF